MTGKGSRWALIILVAAALLVSLGLLAVWVTVPQPAWVQGQIEVTQVRAATKVTGRVVSIDVAEGEHVSEEQRIAVVSSPEIAARAAQADAMVAAAQARWPHLKVDDDNVADSLGVGLALIDRMSRG